MARRRPALGPAWERRAVEHPLDADDLERFVSPYRVEDGAGFRLREVDPGDTRGLRHAFKGEAGRLLKRGIARLAELQERLYADDRWSLLLIFQAMDAAGKDGTIKHVMSGVNPQGVQVHSFKKPSALELDHDFLWRTNLRLPERGRIGIFNRSYYEEVLVARVHPEVLEAQRLPAERTGKKLWKQRYRSINDLERHLWRQGTVVLKFFLHVSKDEQRRRFLDRIERHEKNWKFSRADVAERRFWDDYQQAYEDAIRHTASRHAPWFVVPADHKWFTRLVVGAAVVAALEGLDLHFPHLDADRLGELEEARQALLAEDEGSGRAGERAKGQKRTP